MNVFRSLLKMAARRVLDEGRQGREPLALPPRAGSQLGFPRVVDVYGEPVNRAGYAIQPAPVAPPPVAWQPPPPPAPRRRRKTVTVTERFWRS
jgi:hypothetical protein